MAEEPADRKLSSEELRLLFQLENSLLAWLRTSLSLMGFRVCHCSFRPVPP
jgi:uncharacterized membrane protein YidH (DUF202 family)